MSGYYRDSERKHRREREERDELERQERNRRKNQHNDRINSYKKAITTDATQNTIASSTKDLAEAIIKLIKARIGRRN